MDISASDYQKFRHLLEEHSGILLGENKQYLVISRLSQFMTEHNISNLSDLLGKLTRPTGRQLLQQVVDRMTTNETLWFRDRFPFEFFKSEILKQRNGTVKVWCAACSSGQEPYSLAMIADEAGQASRLDIVATDLSDSMLQRAKEGIYQQIELNRGLSAERVRRFFEPVDTSRFQLTESLRRRVRFQPLNLLKMPYRLSRMDVIFCRNVLIYFSNENKIRVINALVDSLKPGGYLFLGASESMPRDVQALEMLRCNPGLVYRKPEK